MTGVRYVIPRPLAHTPLSAGGRSMPPLAAKWTTAEQTTNLCYVNPPRFGELSIIAVSMTLTDVMFKFAGPLQVILSGDMPHPFTQCLVFLSGTSSS